MASDENSDHSMEPLRLGDPERLGAYALAGRWGQTGAATVFLSGRAGSRIRVTAWPFEGEWNAEVEQAVRSDLERMEPHVIDPLGMGVEGGWAWVATPVVGTALLEGIAGLGAVGESDLDDLAERLGTALADIHEAGLVAGRITPVEVVIEGDDVKLDLAAGVLAAELGDVRGQLPGLAWMAPEQFKGTSTTPETDLHAFGEVLAFAGTGRQPWGPDSTPTALLMGRITQGDSDLGGLPQRQHTLIAGLLSVDPDTRPEAAAIVAAIEDFRRPAPLPAHPTPAPAAVTPMAAPRREGPDRRILLIAAAAVVLVLIAAGVAIALTRGGSADPVAQESSPTSAQPQSSSAPAASVSASSKTRPTTSVNYVNKDIPDKVFPGTLDWAFDVCFSDKALTQGNTASKISLYRKYLGSWQKVASNATATAGGRCDDGKVNIIIDQTAIAPSITELDKGYNSCTDYRVVIPETKNYRKTRVDFCLQTRLDAA